MDDKKTTDDKKLTMHDRITKALSETDEFTFTCRDCGTVNKNTEAHHKICRRCHLTHDGMTDQELKAHQSATLAAKAEGILVPLDGSIGKNMPQDSSPDGAVGSSSEEKQSTGTPTLAVKNGSSRRGRKSLETKGEWIE